MGLFRDGLLKVCDEVCGQKRGEELREIHGGEMKR